MNFFENLEPLLRAFWYIALPVSLFFILQTIMTFMGFGGADADIETEIESHDASDAPFELFSLRNLINFLLGFSWTGISFYDKFENKTILIFIAVVVGVIFVAVFFFIIKQMMKLNENNSFTIDKTLQQTGTVYLTIPEKKSGKGKVQISINGAYHELDAITEHEKLENGAVVKVIGTENTILVVEKI
jgi:membrane-bound ClpP family serine protease